MSVDNNTNTNTNTNADLLSSPREITRIAALETTFSQVPKEVRRIQFGWLSDQEIRAMAVVKITNPDIASGGAPGNVYDPRMGPIRMGDVCPTCNGDIRTCQGHFGYIELPTPILHPMVHDHILNILKCICFVCARLMLSRPHLELRGVMNLPPRDRFEKLVGILERVQMCIHCKRTHPRLTRVRSDHHIYYFSSAAATTPPPPPSPSSFSSSSSSSPFPPPPPPPPPSSSLSPSSSSSSPSSSSPSSSSPSPYSGAAASREEKHVIDGVFVHTLFSRIPDEDVELMGLDVEHTHPSRLVLHSILVLPSRIRPFVVTDNSVCDDDLTIQYNEIVKCVNNITKKECTEVQRAGYMDTLKFRVHTLMDNSSGRARYSTNRELKGIKERICGKTGQIRGNLMGKRVDFSARTVIGPDPSLCLDELGVPREMAETLTYPVHVSAFNRRHLQQLVNAHQAISVSRGDRNYIMKYAMKAGQPFVLEIGDVVHRRMRDGDHVLFNRQPTLHAGSMLAKRVVLLPGKTFRMNLASTSTFNADFDGDEMNIYIPASLSSQVELELLSTSKGKFIGCQASKTNFPIVQDAILGCYLMTDPSATPFLSLGTVQNMLLHLVGTPSPERRFARLLRWLRRDADGCADVAVVPGRFVFSLVLPETLSYAHHGIVIRQGLLVQGAVTGSVLKSGHTSLPMVLYHTYGHATAVEFINNAQFLANQFILHRGFTIGIRDCMLGRAIGIDALVRDMVDDTVAIELQERESKRREMRVTLSLGRIRDVVMRLSKVALSADPVHDNNFLKCVISGSKGDFFNATQVTGMLGQQHFMGHRVMADYGCGTRTLPMFHNKEQGLKKYEAHGFVRHSFLHGLEPHEYWFHTMAGREGITDTAMKTAQTGYIQRRMVKLLEDVVLQHDGTIRMSNNNAIIQCSYGGNSLCPMETPVIENETALVSLQHWLDYLAAAESGNNDDHACRGE